MPGRLKSKATDKDQIRFLGKSSRCETDSEVAFFALISLDVGHLIRISVCIVLHCSSCTFTGNDVCRFP